jgi:hypothetical protein
MFASVVKACTNLTPDVAVSTIICSGADKNIAQLLTKNQGAPGYLFPIMWK